MSGYEAVRTDRLVVGSKFLRGPAGDEEAAVTGADESAKRSRQ